MKALWVEDGTAAVRDVPAPDPPDGESRVRVRLAGVCATDLALRRGYMGFRGVPGHEFVGEAVTGPLAGRRVVGDINAGCGRCPDCTARDGHHCPGRTVLGILGRLGAFAEELALPARNLVPVPDDLPDEAAVFTEPLAAAFEIPGQVAIDAGLPVLVAGDGRLGLLCAQVLARAGADVTVAGRHPERQRLLPEGCRHVTGLLEAPPAGRPFALAVEATGAPETLPLLVPLVQPRGKIVLKTTAERRIPLDLAPFVIDEIMLLGSRCGPLPDALAALTARRIDPQPMIAATYALEDAPAALDHAARPGVLKVLIRPA